MRRSLLNWREENPASGGAIGLDGPQGVGSQAAGIGFRKLMVDLLYGWIVRPFSHLATMPLALLIVDPVVIRGVHEHTSNLAQGDGTCCPLGPSPSESRPDVDNYTPDFPPCIIIWIKLAAGS